MSKLRTHPDMGLTLHLHAVNGCHGRKMLLQVFDVVRHARLLEVRDDLLQLGGIAGYLWSLRSVSKLPPSLAWTTSPSLQSPSKLVLGMLAEGAHRNAIPMQ